MPEDLHFLDGLPNGYYPFAHTDPTGKHICGETVKPLGKPVATVDQIPDTWVVIPSKVGLWLNGVFTQLAQNRRELLKLKAESKQ